MNYTDEQLAKISVVVEKLSRGNQDILKSPSTKVMAINLLNSFNWDIEKVLGSLP